MGWNGKVIYRIDCIKKYNNFKGYLSDLHMLVTMKLMSLLGTRMAYFCSIPDLNPFKCNYWKVNNVTLSINLKYFKNTVFPKHILNSKTPFPCSHWKQWFLLKLTLTPFHILFKKLKELSFQKPDVTIYNVNNMELKVWRPNNAYSNKSSQF